jgi:hypothetical protein
MDDGITDEEKTEIAKKLYEILTHFTSLMYIHTGPHFFEKIQN